MEDWNELKAKYSPDGETTAPAEEESASGPAESLPCATGGGVDGETVDGGGVAQDNAQPGSGADDPSDSDAGPSPAAPQTKPRKKRFWKIYAISTAVFAMLICGLLGFFHVYLSEYEDTRPLSVAKEAVASLAAGVNEPGFIPSEAGEFDRAADIAALFAKAGGTANAEVVEKPGVSTEDVPVFSVREGGREICRVRLAVSGKRRFFDGWQVDGVFFGGDNAVDITLTSETRLLLNGVQAGDAYVVSRDDPLPGYADFADVTPKCVRYRVEGLLYEPEIALDSDYATPKAEFKNGVWVVTYPGSEKNRSDAVDIAYAAAQAYVTYASSQDSPFAPLDRWLIPGSTLRARVLSFDRRYFTRHDSARFANMTDLDFSIYGADEFSVKLSFDYVMRSGKKEMTEKTVMTLYMLRWNGAWKISDVASE